MRAPQRIEPKKIQEVASLLIPLQGQSILLPNVTVAEIIPVAQVQAVEQAPAWYLGNFQWRELTVPLLSLEALNGELVPQLHNRARFAVLNTTGLHGDLAFVALLTQGLPRLARVSEDEISEREDAENRPFDLMHVSWAGEYTLIPDITAIEQAFLDYLHTHDEPAAPETPLDPVEAIDEEPGYPVSQFEGVDDIAFASEQADSPEDELNDYADLVDDELEGLAALENAEAFASTEAVENAEALETTETLESAELLEDPEVYLSEALDSDEPDENYQPHHEEVISQDEPDDLQTRDHF